jgi:hypothetical protein
MISTTVMNQYPKMLKNFIAILDKGAAFADSKKVEMDVLLNSRLAPDQFNLLRQIQIATDVAKLTAARLTGKEPHTDDDQEKTWPELKTRIQKTIAFLQTLNEKDFAGAEDRRITQKRWEGKTLSGADYLQQWANPNIYFHITTAYSILRHNGVEIGKKDYLGELPFRMP